MSHCFAHSLKMLQNIRICKEVSNLKNTLYTPQIEYYSSILKDNGLSSRHSNSYDERTFQLLDELFALLKDIAPISNNESRELWFSSERGPIEKYGNYEELLADGEVSSHEEFESMWKDAFPNEISWHNFTAVENEEIGYRAVFLHHRMVIEQDPRKERGFPLDISEFAEWLVECVKDCIAELEAGTYNERIEKELPPQHRTGIIKRSDYWDIFPERRNKFFENLSPDEIREFRRYTEEQRTDPKRQSLRKATLTANEYFEYCALGYRVNDYSGKDLSPRDQYRKHSDGRDQGLTKIDPDSPEEFLQWFKNPNWVIGHPFEVCRGGNSTHISLHVDHDERGYSLLLAGSSRTRTVETIKFFIALKKVGAPVYLHDAEKLLERVTESEEIGIVPDGIIPAYCHSMFPGRNISDFMNLPYENRELIVAKTHWLPEPKVELLK